MIVWLESGRSTKAAKPKIVGVKVELKSNYVLLSFSAISEHERLTRYVLAYFDKISVIRVWVLWWLANSNPVNVFATLATSDTHFHLTNTRNDCAVSTPLGLLSMAESY